MEASTVHDAPRSAFVCVKVTAYSSGCRACATAPATGFGGENNESCVSTRLLAAFWSLNQKRWWGSVHKQSTEGTHAKRLGVGWTAPVLLLSLCRHVQRKSLGNLIPVRLFRKAFRTLHLVSSAAGWSFSWMQLRLCLSDTGQSLSLSARSECPLSDRSICSRERKYRELSDLR